MFSVANFGSYTPDQKLMYKDFVDAFLYLSADGRLLLLSDTYSFWGEVNIWNPGDAVWDIHCTHRTDSQAAAHKAVLELLAEEFIETLTLEQALELRGFLDGG